MKVDGWFVGLMFHKMVENLERWMRTAIRTETTAPKSLDSKRGKRSLHSPMNFKLPRANENSAKHSPQSRKMELQWEKLPPKANRPENAEGPIRVG